MIRVREPSLLWNRSLIIRKEHYILFRRFLFYIYANRFYMCTSKLEYTSFIRPYCTIINTQVIDTVIKIGMVPHIGRQSGRRRSTKLVPTFADRGVSRGQRNGSPRPLISVFWTGAAIFFIQVTPQLTSRGWVCPIIQYTKLRGPALCGSAPFETFDVGCVYFTIACNRTLISENAALLLSFGWFFF